MGFYSNLNDADDNIILYTKFMIGLEIDNENLSSDGNDGIVLGFTAKDN